MADEHQEPTNKQLANFLLVLLPRLTGVDNFIMPAGMLERMLEQPEYREGALRHHRKFVEESRVLFRKLERGQLQCEHIRTNGRRCPNFNQPGSFLCGLHQDDAGEEQNAGSDEGAE